MRALVVVLTTSLFACAESHDSEETSQALTTVTIGETNILTGDDSQNGNLLVAQTASLTQSATVMSMSFYVTSAGGRLRMGIFDATGPGGGPGAKKAETVEITPVANSWNTANVGTQVTLAPGTYWLTYLPSDNALGFRKTDTGSTSRLAGFTYAPMPATFPMSTSTTASHWSLYATLSVGTTDTTPPSPPSSLVATAATSTRIDLSWSAATDNVGVTGYRVERCQGASCTTFAQVAAPMTTSLADTGLAVSTTYSYRVRAVDAAGNLGAYSAIASATTPAASDTTPPSAPANFAANASGTTQIQLSWTAATDNVGVTGYRVERCQGASCTTFGQVATPAGTSYLDSGLTAATSYSYRVHAVDAAGNASAYSTVATAATASGSGTITIGQTQVLTQDDSGNANLVLAQVATLSQTATVQSMSFYVTSAGGRLRMGIYDATGPGGGPGAKKAETVEITPAANSWNTATVMTPVSLFPGTYWLAYLPSDNALGFRKGAATSNSKFAGVTYGPLPATFSTTPTVTGSHWSLYATLTSGGTADTTPPSAPASLVATASGASQINLSWGAATDNVGVTGYRIERCQGASCTSFAQIAMPAGTTFTDTGLTAATSYSYRARAVDAAGNLGGYSNIASATTAGMSDTTPPTAPTNATATASGSTQILLSWTAATDNVGVTGYRVERCLGASCTSFAQIATPAGASFTDTGLAAGTTYQYRVRAVDAAGNVGTYSNTAAATTGSPDTTPPSAPSNLTATTAGGQINLSWSAATDNVGVTSYRVERCQGASCTTFAQIAAPTGTSLSDTALAGSTTYTYRVRAADAAGNLGGYSNTASATTPATTLFPPDRMTTWAPGLMAVGGIPNRTTICATLQASTYGNGASEASGAIQAALDACPVGQVVQLSAGTFKVNNYVIIRKGITLRGAGPTQTILAKTNGARARIDQRHPIDPASYTYDPQPVVIIGPQRWNAVDNSSATNLTSDAAKGATSITVANAAGFAAGQFVILDELSGATWQTTPTGFPGAAKVWKGDRVAWNMHWPVQQWQDDADHADASGPYDTTPGTKPAAMSWFSRTDRPINEIKEIASVTGNTITFTTPIHITYRTNHTAQLTRYGAGSTHVKNAGVESLKVLGGADGQVRFENAAYSWAKDIDNTQWIGEGFAVNGSFRVEIRHSYIHDGSWPQPGGAGYAISFANAASEILVEDNISIDACKVMVVRSCGAGSVFGYNYTDDAWDYTDPLWVEVGINGSHMAGPHHILFEGNYSFNADNDYTHGNSIYLTYFRNWLSGQRKSFTDTSNARTFGLAYGSWWFTVIGNVFGRAGMMTGWVYEDPAMSGTNANWSDQEIWKLGYDPERWGMFADPQVLSTVIRDGNYDFVTNSVHWHNTPAGAPLPASLYLSAKPAFFGASTWPWVDGVTGAVHTLPAKARYDAATPFAP